MIDLHAHILPGIDDGADSMRMTMEMLAMAADCGVTDVVATPHCNIPRVYENYADEKLARLARKVREEKDRCGIPVRLHRGMEVFATAETPELLTAEKVWTLGNSRYFLTEFSFEEDPNFCMEVLDRCVRRGFFPVIAHPERYYFVQENPEIAFRWRLSGYALQINKGSLLGYFGRREQELAHTFLRHGFAACVASDAHSSRRRTTDLSETRTLLQEVVGMEYAEILLEENPARILKGQQLLGVEPTEL